MTPQETDPDLPINDQESPTEAWVRDGLPQGRGTESGNVCTGPLEGGCHSRHHRATRTYTGLWKQTLAGHKQNLVCTRTYEKGAVSPQETDPDLPVSVQESPAQAWVSGGLLRGWGH